MVIVALVKLVLYPFRILMNNGGQWHRILILIMNIQLRENSIWSSYTPHQMRITGALYLVRVIPFMGRLVPRVRGTGIPNEV